MDTSDEPSPSSDAAAAEFPVTGGGVTGQGSFVTGQGFTSSSSSSSSAATLTPPDFLRHVHAAFKRHRPLGYMQSNFPRATRIMVSRPELHKDTKLGAPSANGDTDGVKSRNVEYDHRKSTCALPNSHNIEESSLTPPSASGSDTNAHGQNTDSHKNGDPGLALYEKKLTLGAADLPMASHDITMNGDLKHDGNYIARDAHAARQKAHQGGQASHGPDGKPEELANIGVFQAGIRCENAKISESKMEDAEDQHLADLMTRCSAHSSVTTATLPAGPTIQNAQTTQGSRISMPNNMTSCVGESSSNVDQVHQKPQGIPRADCNWNVDNKLDSEPRVQENMKGATMSSNAEVLLPHRSSSNNTSVSASDAPRTKPEKERRKKNYDPDLFFKVNGKLYQKLGKIGSGGSSEVHKVISADCTIYALKKIKLKGRDYPTAYGFCQEIEYLKKLKGRSNIIQLIDYEVTDKSLLQEGIVLFKDGKIKDDHFIYMVLEYGEIDLAHMLAHKWKEMNNSCSKLDDNWLRFYWQQMLEAVNTIHDERIVHSDLKPANFLLVRGSLKLIDFGIAKAILNDTTNIQRDAQVGTLNYMSPEAFMCNETDDSGGVIKCGRPSDIWSLGCILYQMVYGKTPFSNYKTFWAKFKVVTDRNHEIVYEPLASPLLIDLMRKCLAWDRNERWRIPQLLQHPFLVPPVPRDPSLVSGHPSDVLVERIRHYWNNLEVSRLCLELDEVITKLEKYQKGSSS